jgi:hypothetical protein
MASPLTRATRFDRFSWKLPTPQNTNTMTMIAKRIFISSELAFLRIMLSIKPVSFERLHEEIAVPGPS